MRASWQRLGPPAHRAPAGEGLCCARWAHPPLPQEQPRLFWTRPWDLAFGHQDVGPHTALVGRPHSLFDRRQLRAHSQAALGPRGRWERLRLTLSCWKRRSPPGPARGHYKTSFILHELGGVPRGRQMEASSEEFMLCCEQDIHKSWGPRALGRTPAPRPSFALKARERPPPPPPARASLRCDTRSG